MTRDEQWLLEEKYNGKETPEFETDRDRLAKGWPVAYLIGSQPFLGLKIYLDSHPLIPRVETEWWTEQLLKEIERREPEGSRATVRLGQAARSDGARGLAGEEPFRFLDLCAGSGAIGCAALAKLPEARVYFGEIDPAHEATIAKNIRENNLDVARAAIRIGDLFEPFANMQFDVIAANPPYVPTNRELPTSVTDYEPARALYAGDDGLELIRSIAVELPKHLAPGGTAWIEVDSAHASDACALFTDRGLSVTIRNDQYEQPRVLQVSRNELARSATARE